MDYRTAPPPAPLLIIASTVTALDRATGATLWTYPVYFEVRRVAIEQQWVLLLDYEGTLHCVDLHTGARLGLVRTKLTRADAFLFDGDRYYVSNSDTVAAFGRDGQELWRQPVATSNGMGLAGLAVPGNIVQPDYSQS